MKLDMAVSCEIFVKVEEIRQAPEKLFLRGGKITFVKNLDSSGDDSEGKGTRIILLLGNVIRKSDEGGGVGDNELLCKRLDFIVGRDGSRERVGGFEIKNLGTREDGGKEGGRGLGDEQEVVVRFRFLEIFKESVFGGGVERFGVEDDKEAVLGVFDVGEGEEITDILNRDFAGFGIRGEEESARVESLLEEGSDLGGIGRKDGKISLECEGGDLREGVNEHSRETREES